MCVCVCVCECGCVREGRVEVTYKKHQNLRDAAKHGVLPVLLTIILHDVDSDSPRVDPDCSVAAG